MKCDWILNFKVKFWINTNILLFKAPINRAHEACVWKVNMLSKKGKPMSRPCNYSWPVLLPFSCTLPVCPADGRAVWCQFWAQQCWLRSALFRSVDIWACWGALNMDYWYCTDCLASRYVVAPFAAVRSFSIDGNIPHGLVVDDVITCDTPDRLCFPK